MQVVIANLVKYSKTALMISEGLPLLFLKTKYERCKFIFIVTRKIHVSVVTDFKSVIS